MYGCQLSARHLHYFIHTTCGPSAHVAKTLLLKSSACFYSRVKDLVSQAVPGF